MCVCVSRMLMGEWVCKFHLINNSMMINLYDDDGGDLQEKKFIITIIIINFMYKLRDWIQWKIQICCIQQHKMKWEKRKTNRRNKKNQIQTDDEWMYGREFLCLHPFCRNGIYCEEQCVWWWKSWKKMKNKNIDGVDGQKNK